MENGIEMPSMVNYDRFTSIDPERVYGYGEQCATLFLNVVDMQGINTGDIILYKNNSEREVCHVVFRMGNIDFFNTGLIVIQSVTGTPIKIEKRQRLEVFRIAQFK